MYSDPVIIVKNLSKCFRVYEKESDRLIHKIFPFKKIKYKEFWALKNVSFKLRKGETLGIIGQNGSGKSTLLQLITYILKPTSGKIITRGRVGALLELGSGFNIEFSGLENIFMNAALMGIQESKLKRCIRDIIDFADIEDFIDQPVKTYSSGMLIRLAFAIQAQTNPDILIVDEALAVGDARFQLKCFNRLKKLQENGSSIILVSHSTEQILTHCSDAILLEKGEIFKVGKPNSVVNHYLELIFGNKLKSDNLRINHNDRFLEKANSQFITNHGKTIDSFKERNGYNKFEYRWGDGAAIIFDYYYEAENDKYPNSIESGRKIHFEFKIKCNETVENSIFGVTIKNKEGITIYGSNTELEAFEIRNTFEDAIIKIGFEFVCMLAQGEYFLSVGIVTKNDEEMIVHDRRYDSIQLNIISKKYFLGLVNLEINYKYLK